LVIPIDSAFLVTVLLLELSRVCWLLDRGFAWRRHSRALLAQLEEARSRDLQQAQPLPGAGDEAVEADDRRDLDEQEVLHTRELISTVKRLRKERAADSWLMHRFKGLAAGAMSVSAQMRARLRVASSAAVQHEIDHLLEEQESTLKDVMDLDNTVSRQHLVSLDNGTYIARPVFVLDPIVLRSVIAEELNEMQERQGVRRDRIAVVKRASVRIGLLDRGTGELIDLGSGTIIDGGAGAPRNQVLTAAHLFIDADTPILRPSLQPHWCESGHTVDIDWLDTASPVIIAIGIYKADDQPSQWCYWAELVTPLASLQELVEHPDAPHAPTQLRDLAALRIRGRLTMTPQVYHSYLTKYSIIAKHPVDDVLAGEATPLPPGVPLGNPELLECNRDMITIFGWFSPSGSEVTLHVPQPMRIMAISKGLLLSEVRLDSAGSGGATCDHEGRLVAINSCSLMGDRTALRMVSWLTDGHGLVLAQP